MTNRVPGLRPHSDRPSSGGTLKGRPQAPTADQLQTPGLKPTASPVDTYARPQAPSGDNNLLNFANALASISPSLNNYLQEESGRRQQEMEDLANRRFAGMSFEEAHSAVESGSIREMENPWFQAAFMKQYGERLAYHRMNELSRAYETDFDKVNGDLDAFIAEAMRADLEQYGDNRFFTASYNQLMQNFNVKAQASQAEYQTGLMVNETQNGVYDTFLGMTRQMMTEGATPEEIFNAIRGRYEDNHQMLHVSFKDQDAELLRVASTLAEEGHYEMVEAILKTPRQGADGMSLGTLAENRDFATDAARIMTRAENVMFDQNERTTLEKRLEFSDLAAEGKLDRDELLEWHAENPGAITDARVHSLIRADATSREQALWQEQAEHERLARVQAARLSEDTLLAQDLEAASSGMAAYLGEAVVLTESGSERTISGEQRRKNVALAISDNLEKAVANGRLTQEEAFGAEVTQLSQNGLLNEKWRNVLSAAPATAAVFLSSGGELPQALTDGLELYLRLHAANPRLLTSHISDSNMQFFESYRIAKTFMRLDDGQALAVAQQATNDPDRYSGPAFAQTAQEIERRVSQMGNDWWSVGPFRTDTRNGFEVGTEVSRIARLYASMGLPVDRALDEAKARFEDTYTNINGWWVYTADQNVPEQFSEWVPGLIESYVTDFPDQDVEADDLTILPATDGSSGAWMIVHRSTGIPVEDDHRRYFTLGDLYDHRQRYVERQQLLITQRTNADNAARDRGLLPDSGNPGFFYSRDQGLFRAEYPDGGIEPVFVPVERGAQGAYDRTRPEWLAPSPISGRDQRGDTSGVQLDYVNQDAVRSLPVSGALESAIKSAVAEVFGPSYRVEVMSVKQTPDNAVGSRRHTTGGAADLWVYDPSGRKLSPDELIPLVQYWQTLKLGGVGFPANGQSLHLDVVGGEGEGAVPLQGGEGMLWFYGTPTASQRRALAQPWVGQATASRN